MCVLVSTQKSIKIKGSYTRDPVDYAKIIRESSYHPVSIPLKIIRDQFSNLKKFYELRSALKACGATKFCSIAVHLAVLLGNSTATVVRRSSSN